MTVANLGVSELLGLLLKLVASYLFALPLGWERRVVSAVHIGLRVLPLISVSSCAYVFLGQQLFTGSDSNEQANMLQGLMTGIGFVGAGAIIKERGRSSGVATAAAIWATGGIGAAIAYGYYVLAAALSLSSLFVLDITPMLAERARLVRRSRRRNRDSEKPGSE
ncbi:MAG: MgtC/SapB family protein [Pseudomonadota bacterium]|nr:MAG: magnesium transporter MgtC [Pseudomonadota bacterium]